MERDKADTMEAYAEKRRHAVYNLSRDLALAAQYAKSKLPRSQRISTKRPGADPALPGSGPSKTQLLAEIKAQTKQHKPKKVVMTGPVSMPGPEQRLLDPSNAPESAWHEVQFCPGSWPPPAMVIKKADKTDAKLLNMRISKHNKRRGPIAGLSKVYKRSVQAELVVVDDDELCPPTSAEDLAGMQAWEERVRQAREEREQGQPREAGQQKQEEPEQQAGEAGPVRMEE